MTKKDLVQELREAAYFFDNREQVDIDRALCIICGISDPKNLPRTYGKSHAAGLLRIANRIEAEYDPKPEPDTLEKVARDMLDRMAVSESEELFRHYADRLEALGVTFDD